MTNCSKTQDEAIETAAAKMHHQPRYSLHVYNPPNPNIRFIHDTGSQKLSPSTDHTTHRPQPFNEQRAHSGPICMGDTKVFRATKPLHLPQPDTPLHHNMSSHWTTPHITPTTPLSTATHSIPLHPLSTTQDSTPPTLFQGPGCG